MLSLFALIGAAAAAGNATVTVDYTTTLTTSCGGPTTFEVAGHSYTASKAGNLTITATSAPTNTSAPVLNGADNLQIGAAAGVAAAVAYLL